MNLSSFPPDPLKPASALAPEGRQDICELLSPSTALPLTKMVTIRDEAFEIASDWHLPMDESVLHRVVDEIIRRKQADVFLCVGDVFDAQQGEETSKWVGKLLNALSRAFNYVAFVPGNHCLRSKEAPWDSFNLNDNVFMPKGDNPILLTTQFNTILIGNCLYDFQLLEPSHLGLTKQGIVDFYQTTKDGMYIKGVSHHSMETMANTLATMLTPDVSLLLTHTVPHPAPVTFRVAELTEEIEELGRRLGVTFVAEPEKDELEGIKWDCSADGYRTWWNYKSFMMGSNILNRAESNPADGLTCIFGHTHRSCDHSVTGANGATIRLLSHQPYGGEDPRAWNARGE
jgi:predicted phosphodiesterase